MDETMSNASVKADQAFIAATKEAMKDVERKCIDGLSANTASSRGGVLVPEHKLKELQDENKRLLKLMRDAFDGWNKCDDVVTPMIAIEAELKRHSALKVDRP